MFTLVHAMFTVLFISTRVLCISECSHVHTPLGVNNEHAERTRFDERRLTRAEGRKKFQYQALDTEAQGRFFCRETIKGVGQIACTAIQQQDEGI